MVDLSLRSGLNAAHITAANQLSTFTGVKTSSLRQQIALAQQLAYYKQVKGPRSGLGFLLPPSGQDSLTLKTTGGMIKLESNGPTGNQEIAVALRYLGFECVEQAAHDQGSASDEPYFIVSIVGGNGSKTQTFGPYEDQNVKTGDSFTDIHEITGVNVGPYIVPPVVIGMVDIEHDVGDPDEARKNVEDQINTAIDKFDALAQAYQIPLSSAQILPAPARGILTNWISSGVSAIFGLGDDYVGNDQKVLWDYDPQGAPWMQLPVLGQFRGNNYNLVLEANGGDAGHYKTYFLVTLIDHRVVPVTGPVT